MGKHLAFYGTVKTICLKRPQATYTWGWRLFSTQPFSSIGPRLGAWKLGGGGVCLHPRGCPLSNALGPAGPLGAVPVVLVPKEISELQHTHSLAGTLPGMAAFKRLINIQIYSSHFNLNSMHIIR